MKVRKLFPPNSRQIERNFFFYRNFLLWQKLLSVTKTSFCEKKLFSMTESLFFHNNFFCHRHFFLWQIFVSVKICISSTFYVWNLRTSFRENWEFPLSQNKIFKSSVKVHKCFPLNLWQLFLQKLLSVTEISFCDRNSFLWQNLYFFCHRHFFLWLKLETVTYSC